MGKKKYFVGFELSEKSRRSTEKIANAMVEEYGINNVFKKYPPHITFKAPFEADKNEIARNLIPFLNRFVKGRKAFTVTLEGFGHFNNSVIYRDVVQQTNQLTDLQQELCNGLERFKWMTFDRTEPNGIAHVTVGIGDIRGRFESIFKFLKDNFPDSDRCKISSIHLFEKHEKEWRKVYEFSLEL